MKERTKTFLIIVLLVGIVSMTIAYANFVSRLKIISNTKVVSSNWDIHFANLVQKELPTNSGTVIESPALIQTDTTIISGLELTLSKPGDYVIYTFDIVNAGDIDAELGNFILGTPVCENNEAFCSNVEYSLNYTNGQQIKVGDYLPAGASINATMRIGLNRELTKLPTRTIDVSNLSAIFDYIQK